MVLDFYEATSTFTLVTTRIFAHPAKRDFVDGLQKTTFPSPPAIHATWLPAFTMTGLSPVRVHCPLLGTPRIKIVTPFASSLVRIFIFYMQLGMEQI
ncbi:MAG: hypothetical protein NUV74_05035 [Candidatus Brocadiaceae bacterium]|nr:hypothetical protein [Candidatus Brocadiaceae bacterium]